MVSENCPKLGSSGAQGFDPYPEVFKKKLAARRNAKLSCARHCYLLIPFLPSQVVRNIDPALNIQYHPKRIGGFNPAKHMSSGIIIPNMFRNIIYIYIYMLLSRYIYMHRYI